MVLLGLFAAVVMWPESPWAGTWAITFAVLLLVAFVAHFVMRSRTNGMKRNQQPHSPPGNLNEDDSE